MQTILIVDDEPSIRNGLKASLRNPNYRVLTAADGLAALTIMKKESVDLLVADIKMPKMDGLTLQEEVRKQNPKQLVILLTAYGSVEAAVDAMRRGAYDFLTKPVLLNKFEMVVARALETKALEDENQQLKNQLSKIQVPLIGHSKVMQELFDKIRAIADTKSTVLIYGESGTGKELIARAIHQLSARKDRPLITVNCAALSENLIESELFGHEKGAFTGAVAKKDGRFKMADQGSLFLDEIGELSPPMQVKLLRAIQEKTIEPVGATYSLTVDTRFLAATNKNLETLVQRGLFREDLYFRLNVVKLDAPPLRKHKEDIPLLADHFLKEFCKEQKKSKKTLSPEVVNTFLEYEWPGNVRELKNVIENLVVFSRDPVIGVREIPENILNKNSVNPPPHSSINLLENEKRLILQALKDSHYNKTEAATRLGMSRRTIHRKIKEYGIDA
jgi:DNA-binding NtrC family response regulator